MGPRWKAGDKTQICISGHSSFTRKPELSWLCLEVTVPGPTLTTQVTGLSVMRHKKCLYHSTRAVVDAPTELEKINSASLPDRMSSTINSEE